LFCGLLSRENLQIWITFCLLNMFLNELSTTVKIRCWSELLTDYLRKFTSPWTLAQPQRGFSRKIKTNP
jgi:hypothetical protein